MSRCLQRPEITSPDVKVIGGCEPPGIRCWEPNSDSLMSSVHSATGTALQQQREDFK